MTFTAAEVNPHGRLTIEVDAGHLPEELHTAIAAICRAWKNGASFHQQLHQVVDPQVNVRRHERTFTLKVRGQDVNARVIVGARVPPRNTALNNLLTALVTTIIAGARTPGHR